MSDFEECGTIPLLRDSMSNTTAITKVQDTCTADSTIAVSLSYPQTRQATERAGENVALSGSTIQYTYIIIIPSVAVGHL